MKKLSVFVEGQTEQLFIERLLEQVAGKSNIAIEKMADLTEQMISLDADRMHPGADGRPGDGHQLYGV